VSHEGKSLNVGNELTAKLIDMSERSKLGEKQPRKSKFKSNANPNLDMYKPIPFPEVYFGGCCWGAAFYIGAYRAMWEIYGPNMIEKGMRVSGDSAGAVIALMIGLGLSPDELDSTYRDMSIRSLASQPWYNPFNKTGSSIIIEDFLRTQILKDPDCYKRLAGVAMFGTTGFPWNHRWHASWINNEDLIDTIKGSYHVPFYCHSIGPVWGAHVVDGAYGFKGSDLLHGDNTLFIGIDPHAEVTRSFTNSEMFYPAVGNCYDEMVQSGYVAMKEWEKSGKFLKKVGQMVSQETHPNPNRQCDNFQFWKKFRTPNFAALKVLWLLKVLEVCFVPYMWIVVIYIVYVFVCRFGLVQQSSTHHPLE
jgi:hypothetical protein